MSARVQAKDQVEGVVKRLLDHPSDPSKSDLRYDDIFPIVLRAREVLLKDAACVEVDPPVVLVGDLHGQFHDAMGVFNKNGLPPKTRYLFLGDYVDRGDYSTETIVLLLGMKLLYPDDVYLLRGNHECRAINRVYGFHSELTRRFNKELWNEFQITFNCLPLCARVGGRIFAMHGGISRYHTCWKMLSDVARPIEVPTYGALCDFLWADPCFENKEDFLPSSRGISSTFSEQVVVAYCKDLELDLVVRGHQVVMDGYEFFAGRRLLTIFSASYYCKEFENSAAVLAISKELECRIVVLQPKGNFLRSETETTDRTNKNDEVEVNMPGSTKATSTATESKSSESVKPTEKRKSDRQVAKKATDKPAKNSKSHDTITADDSVEDDRNYGHKVIKGPTRKSNSADSKLKSMEKTSHSNSKESTHVSKSIATTPPNKRSPASTPPSLRNVSSSPAQIKAPSSQTKSRSQKTDKTRDDDLSGSFKKTRSARKTNRGKDDSNASSVNNSVHPLKQIVTSGEKPVRPRTPSGRKSASDGKKN